MKRKLLHLGRGYALLFTFSVLLFTNACRKTNNSNETQASHENIAISEIIKWSDNINNNFAKPVNMRYDKAQKTFYNNRFYIRVPVDSSTGYFYFTRTSKGLQPLFIRYHSSDKPSDGWAEFIDFNTRKFYKALTYKNYLPEKQYTLNNADLFFNLFFTRPDATTRNTSSTNTQFNPPVPSNPKDCPPINPAALLPLWLSYAPNTPNTSGNILVNDAITDIAALMSQASGGPGSTDCTDPKNQNISIWKWLSNLASDIAGGIGDFLSNLFGGDGDGGDGDSNGGSGFPYPNILLDDSGSPKNNNGSNNNPSWPSNNNGGYQPGPNNPVPPDWQPVSPTTLPPLAPLTYSLSDNDKKIFGEIDREDEETAAAFNKNCQGTLRAGNAAWPGNIEHWMIMMDYVIHNPLVGEIEYQIPGAGIKNGRPGYADIVNTLTGEMFEIKPNNKDGIKNGLLELGLYLGIANSPLGCPRPQNLPWIPGFNYATRTLLPYPKDPTKVIEAKLQVPGVITYDFVSSNLNPLPVLVPISLLDKLKKLVEKLKSSFQPVDVAIAQFLNDPANADLLRFVKNAALTIGIGIIVGTLVEDILTAGVGIADDWASFILAYRIIRFATAL